MLELALNLAWAAIAAAALTGWTRHAGCMHSRRTSAGVQLCALACALVLLFPAISASDDLHPGQLAVEASDVSRKALKNLAPVRVAMSPEWLQALPVLRSVSPLTALRRNTFIVLTELGAPSSPTGFSPAAPDRAPPAPALA